MRDLLTLMFSGGAAGAVDIRTGECRTVLATAGARVRALVQLPALVDAVSVRQRELDDCASARAERRRVERLAG